MYVIIGPHRARTHAKGRTRVIVATTLTVSSRNSDGGTGGIMATLLHIFALNLQAANGIQY